MRSVGFLLTDNEVAAVSGTAFASISLPLLAIALLGIAFVAAFFMILPSKLGTARCISVRRGILSATCSLI